jgi:ketol-acid reductoisomerase
MANYFNSLPLRLQLEQLGVRIHGPIRICWWYKKALKGKKVVIVGCGPKVWIKVEHEIQS